MNKVPPSKIKTKGVPLIGDRTKEIEEVVGRHMKKLIEYLNPMIENISLAQGELDKRLSVMEEVKQIFPNKIEVIVKTEK